MTEFFFLFSFCWSELFRTSNEVLWYSVMLRVLSIIFPVLFNQDHFFLPPCMSVPLYPDGAAILDIFDQPLVNLKAYKHAIISGMVKIKLIRPVSRIIAALWSLPIHVMASYNSVSIGSGTGFLPKLMLTNYQWSLVAFTQTAKLASCWSRTDEKLWVPGKIWEEQ